MIVHNQSVIPFPDEDGIDVAVGLQTNVAISRTFYNRLSDPYSNCIKDLSATVAKKNVVLDEMYMQKGTGKISGYQVTLSTFKHRKTATNAHIFQPIAKLLLETLLRRLHHQSVRLYRSEPCRADVIARREPGLCDEKSNKVCCGR